MSFYMNLFHHLQNTTTCNAFCNTIENQILYIHFIFTVQKKRKEITEIIRNGIVKRY